MKNKRKTFTSEMKKSIIDIYSTHPGTTIQKADAFNDQWGTSFDESAMRKYYKTYTEGLQTGMERNMTDKEIERIGKARAKLRVEQKVNVIERQTLHKTARGIAWVNQFYDRLDHMQLDSGNIHLDIEQEDQTETAKVLLSIKIGDLHICKKSDKHRVEKLFYAIGKFLRQELKLYTKDEVIVRLAFGGDDIEGKLHTVQKESIDDPIAQAMYAGAWYVQGIESILNIVETRSNNRLEIAFVPESNHGQFRYLNIKRGADPRADLGYMIMDKIADWIKYCGLGRVYLMPTTQGSVIDNVWGIGYAHGDKPWATNPTKITGYMQEHRLILMELWHWHHTKCEDINKKFIQWNTASKDFTNEYEEQLNVDSIRGFNVTTFFKDKKGRITHDGLRTKEVK